MSFTYPDITDIKLMPLKVIRSALQDDPSLLDHPACPYAESVKAFLRLVFLTPSVAFAPQTAVPTLDAVAAEEWPTGSDEFDAIDDKVKKLLGHLEKIANNVDLKDTSEQIQIAKAQAQLYDRLLTMRERTTNLKTMKVFEEIILDVIERHLTADNRTAVMTELRDRLGL